MKKIIGITLALFIFQNKHLAQSAGQIKILFDCTKAETAGNADWVIDSDLNNLNWNPYASTSGWHSDPQRYPTPAQSTVTSSTAETYWTGSLSHWAIDCVNKGYWVETLGAFTSLTYGNMSNVQDLSNYNIFIVDEPNILFTAAQKTAMMNFVLNGGSLFMISDHTMSDRNNDGYDSPAIWNDFITNNGVQNNATGFTFDLQNFSMTSYNVANLPSDSLLHGPFGNVTQVKWTSGTSMTLNTSQNPSVTGVVYKTGSSNTGTTGALCAYARVGCGKVVGVGDSSIPDDGTGNTNATLYNGYTLDAAGNHQRLLMNATIWLAQASCFTGINDIQQQNQISVFPNPSSESVTISFLNNGSEEPVLNIFNTNGQLIPLVAKHTKNSGNENYILDLNEWNAGIYYCQIKIGNKIMSRKISVIK